VPNKYTGRPARTIMAGLAEFERDLIRERVKSGLAAARSRGVVLGRQVGQRLAKGRAMEGIWGSGTLL
jgi:DNA invertase Pin-like site-specific DNA recombinase